MRAALLAAALLLAGCTPEPTMDMQDGSKPAATQASPNWRIERVAVFRDDLAYDETRGIYVLTDTRTGRQYVGVSGIGISQIGSIYNAATKTTMQDER